MAEERIEQKEIWVDEEEQFIEPTTPMYGKRDDLSQRSIILRQLERLNALVLKTQIQGDAKASGKPGEIKSLDNRPIIIMGVQWLSMLLSSYKDKPVRDFEKSLNNELENIERKIYDGSLNREAYNRATGNDAENFNASFNHWKNYLKQLNLIFIDKDTPDYEYYLDIKLSMFIRLMEQLILLINRNNWLSNEIVVGAYDMKSPWENKS